MKQITIVRSDDWEGLYDTKGNLYIQYHDISKDHIWGLLQQTNEHPKDIELISLWVDDSDVMRKELEANGEFPNTLQEVYDIIDKDGE